MDGVKSKFSCSRYESLRSGPQWERIAGEAAQKDFIGLFGAILRLRNILVSFDDFDGKEILTPRQMQDYQSVYLDLYAEYRVQQAADRESIIDDVVFEIELIKQVEVNVDYILMLVEKYRDAKGKGEDKEIRIAIEHAIDSSPTLRNKKDLIEAFVDSISATAAVDIEWQEFVAAKKVEELERIIVDEGLNRDATHAFINNAFRDGAVQIGGTAITTVLPAAPRFAQSGGHAAKKQTVLEKLSTFFERFQGLG